MLLDSPGEDSPTQPHFWYPCTDGNSPHNPISNILDPMERLDLLNLTSNIPADDCTNGGFNADS